MRLAIPLLLPLWFLQLPAQVTKRVLFLGNSYTASYNLPQLVASVASSAGDSLVFSTNAPGGYTLQGHSTNATSLNLISQGNWDFVVLQEQSQLPSWPIAQVQTDVFPYARALDSVINLYNPCGETMFFMTWGRKKGDAANCGWWPPVCTYEGMDSLLRLRYMMMAEDNHAVVSPVGAVWRHIRQNHPTIELYEADESHPSAAGSYAAACCFYAAIFGKDPELIHYDFLLPAADAVRIRQAAKTIVYDSLLNWHIGEYVPEAGFSESVTSQVATFTNLSEEASTFLWHFGDGDTSTSMHPIHIYASTGTYPVTLIASHCGLSDTASHDVTIVTVGESDINRNGRVTVYPNLTGDVLTVVSPVNGAECNLMDMSGRVVMTWVLNSGLNTLALRDLPEGVFLVAISSRTGYCQSKVVVAR